MDKVTLVYTYGLPASGKSTWAKAWVNEDPKKRVRVNRDDIRRMLGPYWQPSREDLVTSMEVSLITDALIDGYNVVVDATNFRFDPEQIKDLIGVMIYGDAYYNDRELETIINEKITVVKKDFTDISVIECIRRDLLRKDTESYVGSDVILGMAKKYLGYEE